MRAGTERHRIEAAFDVAALTGDWSRTRTSRPPLMQGEAQFDRVLATRPRRDAAAKAALHAIGVDTRPRDQIVIR